MLKEQLKNSILCDLKSGVIQPFQIEEQLRLKGASSFEISELASEIAEKYRKSLPRY